MGKEYVFAIRNYEGIDADELSFSVGEKIEVLEMGDDSSGELWWEGINEAGKTGAFPPGYTSSTPPASLATKTKPLNSLLKRFSNILTPRDSSPIASSSQHYNHRKRPSASPSVPPASGSPPPQSRMSIEDVSALGENVKEYVYALRDYVQEDETKLSFIAGERIEVIEKDEFYHDGWWTGINQARKIGLFPVKFTTPSQPGTGAKASDRSFQKTPSTSMPTSLGKSRTAPTRKNRLRFKADIPDQDVEHQLSPSLSTPSSDNLEMPTQASERTLFGAPNFTGCWTKLADIPSATGGNSDIYKARLDKGAQGRKKLVAVKILRSIRIRPDCVPEEILRKRLMREMRVWTQLEHENIVPFLGYAFSGDFPCMVAPWYENGNLPDYMSRFPDIDRTQMVLESINGLVYLHSRDPPIVHGDLKASNILVDDEGHARITDFGLSRIVEEGHTGWTTSTGISGTHRWMAPELLLTERSKPTIAADVYSITLLALEVNSISTHVVEITLSADPMSLF
ncbi:hypothetical protein FRC03_002352 [Tulasnella sp. 419]|nr:hypothetical protein FRC03_002352 [Tulasnella sp. 419]